MQSPYGGVTPDRLTLARRLTEACPTWAVWKNADSALVGRGDIDSVAPPSAHHALVDEFRIWSARSGLGPIVLCPHLPGSLFVVAVRGDGSIEELHLSATEFLRGGILFDADDLVPLMMLDPRGFRRLLPGAEAFFLLLYNGMAYGARPRWEQLREKRIPEGLGRDPDGVALAAGLLGWARRPALAAAAAVARGEWDRRSLLLVEAWAIARSMKTPRLLGARTLFRALGGRMCRVVGALQAGRRVTDTDRWLHDIADTHTVYSPLVR